MNPTEVLPGQSEMFPRVEKKVPATTPNPNKQGKSVEYTVRFVKCELTAADKIDLKEKAGAVDIMEEVWRHLSSLVEDGHVLSIKSMDVGFQASLTANANHRTHASLCLIARGSSPRSALISLWYRDTVILQGKWAANERLNELDL